jgi:hypothetical protein
VVHLKKYFLDGPMQEDGLALSYGTHDRSEKCIENFSHSQYFNLLYFPR